MRIGSSDAHWVLPGRLLVSRAPREAGELQELRAAGATDLLSLLEPGREPSWARQAGIRFASSPLAEMGSPRADELLPAVLHVHGVLQHGQACLVVHCQAGMGRAPVVAAAYLALAAGLPSSRVIEEVRHRRPGALWGPDKERSVEEIIEQFQQGQLRGVRSGSCTGCGVRLLAGRSRCLGCSDAPSLDAFFGCPVADES